MDPCNGGYHKTQTLTIKFDIKTINVDIRFTIWEHCKNNPVQILGHFCLSVHFFTPQKVYSALVLSLFEFTVALHYSNHMKK